MSISVRGQDGTQLYFKIKRRSPLKMPLDVYSQRQGGTPSAYRFFFDGVRIFETQTPASLEMESDDVIEAVLNPVDIGVFGEHSGSLGVHLLMGSTLETQPLPTAAEVRAIAQQLGGRVGSRPQSYPSRQLLPLHARQVLIHTLDTAYAADPMHDIKLDLTRSELTR
eukprot:COSAG06_NODE_3365_length_5449_cov_2.510280_6_plen_167_part_00